MTTCAGIIRADDSTELAQTNSESSQGLLSTSLVEPQGEAASTRQQLLIALSLLKHMAHHSPSACEAMVAAGAMDPVRRCMACAPVHTVCHAYTPAWLRKRKRKWS